MFDYDSLFILVQERKISQSRFLALANENSLDVSVFFNNFALHIASRYLNGQYSFESSNDAVNWVFGAMVDDSLISRRGYKVPSPAYDIFLAFDAGEFQHSGDTEDIDPVAEYTDKKLKDILSASV